MDRTQAQGTQTEPAVRAAPIVVRVQHTALGRWAVVAPGRPTVVNCETLEDARRIAYLSVAHSYACELIVRDAYNRVLEHQLIDARPASSAGRGR